VNRHAKASSAGSTKRQASGLGRIFRGAFATRGGSSDFDGSGASSIGGRGTVLALLVIALGVLVVTQAFAAKGVVKSIGASSPGSTGGLFSNATGVAVNTSGNGAPAGTLYVVDSGNNRIQRFDSSGNFVSAFGKDVEGAGVNLCTTAASCTQGSGGSGAGQFGFFGAQGIAVEPANGTLFITDESNRRVDVYSGAGAFEGAFGWNVNATTPEEKLQFCTTATGCQQGSLGSGAGQFGFSLGYPAFDPSSGNLYVADRENRRVDEFEPQLSGGEVTGVSFVKGYGWGAETGAEEFQVCTATCHEPAGTGSAQGQFSFNAPSELGVDNSGNVYALDPNNNRVQKFSPAGSPLDSSFASGTLGTSPAPSDLYVNPAAGGHVFAAKSNGSEVDVLELNSAGSLLETHASGAGIGFTSGVTLDPAGGNVYLSSGSRVFALNTPLVPPSATIDPVTTFTAHTAQLSGTVNPNGLETTYQFEISPDESTWTKIPASPAPVGSGSSAVPVSQEATGLTANTLYHVRLVAAKPFGAGTTTTSQTTFSTTAITPEAEAFASEVEREEAVLGAEIDPNGSATTFQLQYVDDAHYQPLATDPYEEGDVIPATPASVGSGTSTVTVSKHVEGLTPATIYHYRVVAANSVGTTESPDHTIITLPSSFEPETDCPNQQFRIGPAANLPDCRAYEMVSPLDKGGEGILAGVTMPAGNERAAFDQAAVGGDAITYTSKASFGDEPSNLSANQYLSQRGPDGWTTHGISPPRGKSLLAGVALVSFWAFGPQFDSFSEDLSSAWLHDANAVPLLPSAAEGFASIYRRDNTDDTYHESVINSEPLFWNEFAEEGPLLRGDASDSEGLQFRGRSKDGSHVVFSADAQLTPDAAANLHEQLYEYSGGELHLVSVLPGGEANPFDSYLGMHVGGLSRTGEDDDDGRAVPAVSEDGSRVFWTDENYEGNKNNQGGKLYVRIDNSRTVPVSESVTTDKVQFQVASADGSKVAFTTLTGLVGVEEELYEFDVDTETPTFIADDVTAVPGASDDLSYLYFVSEEALDAGATAGRENLYVRHNGANHFVATLAEADVIGERDGWPSVSGRHERGWPLDPRELGVRVTPDGRHLAFMSKLSLTGYDNTDAVDGKPDTEVFLYDAEAGRLSCVSCNPTGARPHGGITQTPLYSTGKPEQEGNTEWRTAAWIPPSEHSLDTSRLLSADGNRIFFNANDALVPQDTNGHQDVYEWEDAGTGSCTTSAQSYSAQDDGCISLISTGKSSVYSEFIDASASGDDVFIRTESGIDPRDLGLMDVYDARAGGGFPLPTKVAACEGEACQNAPEAPNDPTPGSSSYNGPGNVSEAPLVSKKHGKKHHKRRHAHKRHRANNNRRAAR
jgi:DNA-binding beta-propeller fold protein YncE